MAVPKFHEFIEPLLRVLAEHPDGLETSEAYEATAERVGLSEEDKREMIPSGQQARYKNRIGWAHDRLKRAGLSHSVDWGVWKLTDEGRTLVEEHSDGLDDEFLERIARPRKYDSNDASDEGSEHEAEGTEPDEPPQPEMTPDERIDTAIEQLQESVSNELLEAIQDRSAEFFEHLVLDVLQAMGYGTGQESIYHRGATSDGGIDGVISLDHLGLEKIYVQAKRWDSNTVGRPQLQKFYGALSERQASKGVFITTSTFSDKAREFAESINDSIVLIDGDRLTSLMIEHGVGVRSERTVDVVDINRDYFEAE